MVVVRGHLVAHAGRVRRESFWIWEIELVIDGSNALSGTIMAETHA